MNKTKHTLMTLAALLAFALISCEDLSLVYTVTFSTGEGGGTPPPSQMVERYGQITLPGQGNMTAPSGKGFAGWKDEFDRTWLAGDTYSITGDVTFTAYWSASTYLINFNSNSGSSVTSQYHGFGEMVSKPPDPTRTGYTFGGWYKEEELINEWDFNTDTVTENITLYAKWLPITAVESGEFSSETGDNVLVIILSDGNLKSSLTISQFTLSTAGTGGFTSLSGGNVTRDSDTQVTITGLTAVTTPGSGQKITLAASAQSKQVSSISVSALPAYTVTFDSNQGSYVSSQSIIKGGKATSPSTPTRTEYSFEGWYRDPELTVPWNFTVDTVTENITLYAKWTEKTYKVYTRIWTYSNWSSTFMQTLDDSHVAVYELTLYGYNSINAGLPNSWTKPQLRDYVTGPVFGCPSHLVSQVMIYLTGSGHYMIASRSGYSVYTIIK
jgi:uncharacterized repeat protein (TIGR02543 family)